MCEDESCPSLKESPFDSVAGLVIFCVVQAITFVFGYIVIKMPGSWFKNPVLIKGFPLMILVLFPILILNVTLSKVNRGYVFTYYSVNPYSIEVSQSSSTVGTMTISNYYSKYIENDKLMVVVYEIDEEDVKIEEISVTNEIVYQDEDSNKATELKSNTNITREIDGLEDGKWYMWTLQPARQKNDKNYPTTSWNDDETTKTFKDDETTYEGNIDTRAYGVCQWSKTTGCNEQPKSES